MADKYIDFDEYRKEKENEPLIIKAYGKEYELPPSPRLSIMEKLIELKNKEGKNATVPEEEMIAMIDALMGADARKELSEKGVEIDGLEWLLKNIWKKYNAGKKESGTKNPTNSTSQKTGD